MHSKRYITALIISIIALVLLDIYWTPYRAAPQPLIGEFGGVSLRLELAMTVAARERGLGGSSNVPDGYGMLFVFPKSDRYGFWMKDMHVPIDIFWLDENGYVVSFIGDVATSTYPNVFYPSIPARYVLETKAGFIFEHHIATGTPLLLQNWPTVLE